MTYNYYTAQEQDIRDYIEENIELADWTEDREGLEEQLYNDLWITDSVTGNASGSYTFCRDTARECVTDNMGLLAEAVAEFCISAEELGEKILDEEWEYLDVTIRCYILGQSIAAVLDEMESGGLFDAIEDTYIPAPGYSIAA